MNEDEMIEHMQRMLSFALAKRKEASQMPLTKSGNKVMRSMKSQYGAKKGKEVFYASINKSKPGASKWHRKTK